MFGYGGGGTKVELEVATGGGYSDSEGSCGDDGLVIELVDKVVTLEQMVIEITRLEVIQIYHGRQKGIVAGLIVAVIVIRIDGGRGDGGHDANGDGGEAIVFVVMVERWCSGGRGRVVAVLK
ncbi:hypothetical protein CsSME_00038501 [Camellia sinensis var. sinensis]